MNRSSIAYMGRKGLLLLGSILILNTERDGMYSTRRCRHQLDSDRHLEYATCNACMPQLVIEKAEDFYGVLSQRHDMYPNYCNRYATESV